MEFKVKNLTEFGLVKLINSLPFPVICLDIKGGPCYLVAPGLKKLKETKYAGDYPRFEFLAVDVAALDRAFMYYGYEMVMK